MAISAVSAGSVGQVFYFTLAFAAMGWLPPAYGHGFSQPWKTAMTAADHQRACLSFVTGSIFRPGMTVITVSERHIQIWPDDALGLTQFLGDAAWSVAEATRADLCPRMRHACGMRWLENPGLKKGANTSPRYQRRCHGLCLPLYYLNCASSVI